MNKQFFLVFLLLNPALFAIGQAKKVTVATFPPDEIMGTKQAAYPGSITISSKVLYKGKPSIRFQLKKTDSTVAYGKRAEIVFHNEKVLPVERWYAFKIFLPATYDPDSLPEIVAQWHAIPDFSWGETWRSPPISLMIQNGRWLLVTLWASDSVNTNKTITGREIVDIGHSERMKWTAWVFHIKFSYKKNGLLEVWKDGQKIYHKNGPNFFNDRKGPFFKFGIYKWDWMKTHISSSVSKRVLYFADIKLGDENCTYQKIMK